MAVVAFSEPSGSTMGLAPTRPMSMCGLSSLSSSAKRASVGKEGVLVSHDDQLVVTRDPAGLL